MTKTPMFLVSLVLCLCTAGTACAGLMFTIGSTTAVPGQDATISVWGSSTTGTVNDVVGFSLIFDYGGDGKALASPFPNIFNQFTVIPVNPPGNSYSTSPTLTTPLDANAGDNAVFATFNNPQNFTETLTELFRIKFTVRANAADGTYPILGVRSDLDSYYDTSVDSLPITDFAQGSITIGATAVPEPSSFALIGIVAGAMVVRRKLTQSKMRLD